MGELKPADKRGPRRVSVRHFVAGLFLAIVLSFLVSIGSSALRSTFTAPDTNPQLLPPLWVILLAWIVTIGVFALLFRWHPWAAYGALAGYAALLAVFLLLGGMFGPSTCFNAYGYPYGSLAPQGP